MSEEFDWNKHMKVFTNEVAVKVNTNITRQDVLLSLLNEGEIAFKGKKGNTFILTINEKWDKEMIEKLITRELEEVISEDNANVKGDEE